MASIAREVCEVVYDDQSSTKLRFVINAQIGSRCKTCNINDPAQNIDWAPREGGGEPNYATT